MLHYHADTGSCQDGYDDDKQIHFHFWFCFCLLGIFMSEKTQKIQKWNLMKEWMKEPYMGSFLKHMMR